MNLSAAKQELLRRTLTGSLSDVREIPGAEESPASAPLTFGQRQVWLHAQLAPGLPLYNEPVTIHRKGPLDLAVLRKSLGEILRRHSAWRTCFPAAEGLPVQRVLAPFDLEIPFDDLLTLPPARRELEALRLATEDARQPFDLERGPLLRARLVRIEREDFRLFLTLHHLIFDGVSIYRVFLPELVALYTAFSAGRPSPLPPVRRQYVDFARWQHSRFRR